MLREMKTLVGHVALKIQRNDVLLNRKKSEHNTLITQIDTFEKEISAIEMLSRSLYPGGETNKAKIFAIQRRQGALKRKLADIKVQKSQKMLEQEKCEQERLAIFEKRKLLDRKIKKYESLQQQARKNKRISDAKIEDNEIEERISWRR